MRGLGSRCAIHVLSLCHFAPGCNGLGYPSLTAILLHSNRPMKEQVIPLDTLRALEDALLSFAGSVMVISHDRWFLDRIATHILAFEGEGYVHWCEGNFQTYQQQRSKRLGIAEGEVRQFRYKRLKVGQ